jgi:hypothetical protein
VLRQLDIPLLLPSEALDSSWLAEMTHTSSFHQNIFALFTLPPFFLSALLHYSLPAHPHTNLTAYLHFSAPRFAWPPFILLLLPVWSSDIPHLPFVIAVAHPLTPSLPVPTVLIGMTWHGVVGVRSSVSRLRLDGKYMHDGAYFQRSIESHT